MFFPPPHSLAASLSHFLFSSFQLPAFQITLFLFFSSIFNLLHLLTQLLPLKASSFKERRLFFSPLLRIYRFLVIWSTSFSAAVALHAPILPSWVFCNAVLHKKILGSLLLFLPNCWSFEDDHIVEKQAVKHTPCFITGIFASDIDQVFISLWNYISFSLAFSV